MILTLGLITYNVSRVPRPADRLWSALEDDYPGRNREYETRLKSRGILASSRSDESSNATSYLARGGVLVRRLGVLRKLPESIFLPWADIEKVEVVEPAPELLEKGGRAESRSFYGALLTAKVTLRRDDEPLTLAIPWNEAFEGQLPQAIHFEKDWKWPGHI